MSEKIKSHHLERKAILYIRQSSAYQVSSNIESQKLHYAVQERLRQLGWRDIDIVDDDLGRSAAGMATRAGFERMVAEVYLNPGQVSAVAAREVPRFACNSRKSGLSAGRHAACKSLCLNPSPQGALGTHP